MRALLAALMIFAASPATAGTYADWQGRIWDLVEPPEYWFSRPSGEITYKYLPEAEVFRICEDLTTLAGQFGCAIPRAKTCEVFIVDDLPKPLRNAITRHETAHCHGWGGHHPIN